MDEGMFFENFDWGAFEDYQLLALRAFAPEDVFTDEAREKFLEQVGDNAEELADALFGDDSDLVNLLPDNLEMLRDYLVGILQKAYQLRIREADPSIG